ncbi:MAG: hypothetical protein ABIL27_06040 [candidate division WOR-3 bacterium]
MKRIIYLSVLPALLWGHERLFLYTYDTDLLPSGFTEFETWLTIKQGREGQFYSAQDLRLELEHAFTPNLSTDIYLDFGKEFIAYPDGQNVNKTSFKGLAWAWIYRLPPFGFYGELYYYGHEVKGEVKLLLSKNIGNFQLASNIIGETEFEREGYDEIEREAEFSITGGLVYKFPIGDRSFSVGFEGWSHSEWPDKVFPSGNAEHFALFIGPVIHYSHTKFWITAGLYPQITRVLDEHESFNFRLIMGILL